MTRRPQGKPGEAGRAREAARAAAAAARADESARRRRERIMRVTAIVVVLLIVAAGTVFAVLRSQVDADAPTPATVTAQGGPITVGSSGPVVDVFEDFQCPFCKQFEATNGELLTRYAEDGKITVRYHLASFLGPESQRAANAAGCAADADRFPAFHALLYANQPPERTGGFTADQLIAHGTQAGIDGSASAAFEQCVRDSTYAEWVKAVQLDFDSRGLRGTPTVMIDGTVVAPEQYDATAFKALLDAAAS